MRDLIRDILAVWGAISATISIYQSVRVLRWKQQLTWDDALRTAEKVLTRIRDSGWRPELVIGIGRSGGIWGGWLAGNMGSLPFALVDDRYQSDESFRVDFPAGHGVLASLRETYPEKRRLLVVEGASSTGQTLSNFVEQFSKELEGCEVKFAVLYQNPAAVVRIDFVGEVGPEPWPKKFPWHFTNLYRPYLRDVFSLQRPSPQKSLKE